MRYVMQADQINWPTTIVNLGLWTRPGIPTKATRLKTHQAVRFFGESFLPCWLLCRMTNSCGAGRFYFIRGV